MTDAAGRVIIVGAGPIGLGAALELARCGVRSVLVEKHETTSWHPKTRNLNTRTMEIALGWGTAVYKRLWYGALWMLVDAIVDHRLGRRVDALLETALACFAQQAR